MIKTIPLNRLVASQRNVRRSSDEQADLQLKADIEARGLLQNLVVTSVKKPKDCFEVRAGGRRRRALQALADEGKLAADEGICCLVLDGDVAREASLAENFQRLAMNPADECLAFQQLIADGADAEGVARRFGLTVRFAEGRLRLANLAPVVFEALGAGVISLDVAKAYAASPDVERQAYVYEQAANSYVGRSPDSIRRMITQATVSANDRRALFVGEEAYVSAGGRVERDLFDDAEGARWLDVALLERLASEKLEAFAADTAQSQGLAFVRPTLASRVGYGEAEGLKRIAFDPPPLTDAESAEVAELEDAIGSLETIVEDEDAKDEARDEAQAKIRALGDRIEAITDKPLVIDDETKAKLGAFLLLDEHGRTRLDTSFYIAVEQESPISESSDELASEGTAGIQAEPQRGLSRQLIDELAIQRRDILAIHVAGDPAFALNLAIFLMIDRPDGYSAEKKGSSLSAHPPANPVNGFKTLDAKAVVARIQADDALDLNWIEGKSRAERFDAFRSLSDEARAAWLGHAVARTLEASAGAGERTCTFHDHLGQLLQIDVASWWRPTGVNYVDRVPKALALDALTEVGGPALSGPYAKAKKGEVSQACERIFAGNFIAEVAVKQAALAWLPDPMRFGAPANEPAPDEAPDDELSEPETDGLSSEPPSMTEEVEEAA